MALVKEQSEVTCDISIGRLRNTIATTRVRNIQLPEPLTEQFGKIEVIVDVREELRICLFVFLPVNSVNVSYIEFLFNLLPYMVEDILPFLLPLSPVTVPMLQETA